MARGGAFQVAAVIRVAMVAVIAAITQIALTVAFTAITFRDDLAVDLNLGLTAMFVGMLVTAVVVGLRSGLGGHVVSPQDSGLVVLSLVAPTIAASADLHRYLAATLAERLVSANDALDAFRAADGHNGR